MKAKTLVACVLTASALPLTPAFAQYAQPGGPQGTGWYGVADPLAVPPAGEVILITPVPADSVSPGASVEPRAYERDSRRADVRRPMWNRGTYDGSSSATNPPVPAP